MIGEFLKKDLLTLIRNRNELLVLLAMPLVLISILGFALGGFISGGTASIQAKVAVVNYGDEENDLEAFNERVQSLPLSDEKKNTMINGAGNIRPISMLIEGVFENEELKEIIETEQISVDEFEHVKNGDEYTAIIEIPEQFTLNVLSTIFLGEKGEGTELLLYKNEGRQISPEIVEELLEQFQREFSTMTVLGMGGIDPGTVIQSAVGTVDTVSKKKPVNSVSYYTVGMNVMFIMFVASTISSFAYREKRLKVFDRILLTNVSRWAYFAGIIFSTVMIALVQQLLLYGISALVFQVRWEHLSAFFVVNIVLSFAIGGLGAFLTAMNFRLDSENASNVFNSLIVTLFALLGGSFIPIGENSSILNVLGNLTPNGSGMTALLKLLQGYGWQEIYNYLFYLILIGMILLAAAVIVFPKRRASV
ncbi:ABC transporter permease [Fervidibacillus albus]|uniref:ABC transporter permease n=1 Tax=Fervidibacillus albus TaxID=2980026 RepID=A0A9E8LS74_9BACI|nr:ABC transporter permease [Fervidibacillus albus]WAA08588.1 ABC transporter permease [Fervidibacillus albus]